MDRKFYEHYDLSGNLVRVYCCPCCGYPTVGEPPNYDICAICSWEDDLVSYDDPNASGANGNYSLDEARANFKQYLTMYRATHEVAPQFQRPGLRYVHDLELRPERLDRKRRSMTLLDSYMAEPDPHRRGEIWEQCWERSKKPPKD